MCACPPQEGLRDQEAEESREIKLIIVDLLAQVLLDNDDKAMSNFTSVIKRIRQLSKPKAINLNGAKTTSKVIQTVWYMSWLKRKAEKQNG